MTDLHELYRELYDKVKLLNRYYTFVSDHMVIYLDTRPGTYHIMLEDTYYQLSPFVLRDISYGEGSESRLIYSAGDSVRKHKPDAIITLHKLLDVMLVFSCCMRVSTKR